MPPIRRHFARAIAALCVTTAAASEPTTPTPPVRDDLLFIDNGEIRLGVKKDWGAGIAWLSDSGSDRNLINAYDHGRLVQQSYYGEADGSLWNGKPWKWNPVQGGDWKGKAATVEKLESGRDWLESVSIPRHWASGEDIDDMRFSQRIDLRGRVATIRFSITYTGTKSHPKTHQEIPAVFVAPELETLVYYDGNAPWTGAPLTRRSPGWPNESGKPAEPWAAWVDASDHGIGICVPVMEEFTCYRFAAGTGSPAACSYIAPLATFAVTPGKSFQYECHLTPGSLNDIRARFQALCAPAKDRAIEPRAGPPAR